MLKKIWDWLVISSANPQATALTVKGAVGTVVGLLVMISPIMGIGLAPTGAETLTNDIVSTITALLTSVSALATVIGLVRKIFRTFIKQ